MKLSTQGKAAIDRQDERTYRWRKAGEGRPEQQVVPSSADKPATVPAAIPPAPPAAASVPYRPGGKVSAAWLAGVDRDAEHTRRTDRGLSGTSPETLAEIRAVATRERDSLAAFKKPLSADERREIAARAGRGRRVAI